MRTANMAIGAGLLLPLSAACAAVDPQPDYDEVERLVARAPRAPGIWRPAADDEARERVAALLDDGLGIFEAVELALLNNPELQRSLLRVGIARADRVQAGLLPNPFIGLALRFPAGGGSAEVEGELAQEVAMFWQMAPLERAAEAELGATILAVAREASTLALRTQLAYFEAQAAAERSAIAAENVAVARELLRVAEAREEAGAGNQLEVNVALSELGVSRLEERDAELSLRRAFLDLASALGLARPPCVADLTSPLPDPPECQADETLLLDLAERRRLDLEAARRAVAVARERLEAELRRRTPRAELGLSWERVDGVDAIGPGVGVEIPLFDQNQARIAKARYLHMAAERELEGLRLEVHRQVLQAHERARIEWETAAFFRDELLPHGRRNMELSREAYQEGKVSFLSALEAQQRFLEMRREYVERRLRSAVVCPELEQALGIPLEELRKHLERGSERAQGDGHED